MGKIILENFFATSTPRETQKNFSGGRKTRIFGDTLFSRGTYTKKKHSDRMPGDVVTTAQCAILTAAANEREEREKMAAQSCCRKKSKIVIRRKKLADGAPYD